MANGFGSMFIGVAGLQSAQNALNTTANNLSNVDTTGYVRQQVLFADRDYVTFNTTAAISKQQSGLGVKIGDVVHTRDVFLDRLYRTTSGREAFYNATHEATTEVETYFQELEGQAFQEALTDFWESFQEFYKAPDDSIYQNLVIQKAQLFVSRSDTIYSGLKSYQYNINTQIKDDINRVNELGDTIRDLNTQIQKIEAGNIETAMTLRDVRDQALDELSSLVDISYKETTTGVVTVSIEGQEFIDELNCRHIEMQTDKTTGFVTPYWGYLSDPSQNQYTYLFNFNRDISTENKNDMGEIKALVLARGDKVADYTDVEGVDKRTYNDTTDMSVMLRAEAQLDQLFHNIVTSLNDILCPNVAASEYITGLAGGGSVTMTGVGGTTYTVDENTLILDMDNCSVGADGSLPPQELFSRIGTDRYTEVSYTDPATGEAKTYYIYNEEDPTDGTKQYTMRSVSVNDALVLDETVLPHLKQNGDVDQTLAAALAAAWENSSLSLSPNDTNTYNFKEYYTAMIGELGTYGDVFGSNATNLQQSLLTVDNQRQNVIGVSSDEELTYMIKYQNAYNASSRFINVINEMIEHLITQLG